MSLKLYDECLANKIKAQTNKTDIHIYGVQETKRIIEVNAAENNDNPLSLPIITISRDGGYEITNINKKPMTYDGVTGEASSTKSITINAVPISIKYQIDVWTRYFEDADEYARNLVFNIINYPVIPVHLKYKDGEIIHNSTIRLVSDVQDTSDVPERLVPGQFSRLTIECVVDDAYLQDLRERDNLEIVSIKVEPVLPGEN